MRSNPTRSTGSIGSILFSMLIIGAGVGHAISRVQSGEFVLLGIEIVLFGLLLATIMMATVLHRGAGGFGR